MSIALTCPPANYKTRQSFGERGASVPSAPKPQDSSSVRSNKRSPTPSGHITKSPFTITNVSNTHRNKATNR